MLQPGDAAPAFRATTTDHREVALADFKGRWLVLYFFPKAFTPGCTAESKRFRDNHEELRALGAEIVGISHDALEVQCEFARSLRLGFPLIADAGREVGQAFGAARTLLPVDKRVTFVIDPGGVIRAVFQHEFQVSRHLDDVRRFLEKQAGPERASP